MTGPDIKEMERLAVVFERHVNEAKAELAHENIQWYPYRTLSTFWILDKLLTGPRRRLLDLAAGDAILDIGCGDGAISFFLESLGCRVLALDNRDTNHNRFKGFLALRAALNSSVPLESIDLDARFTLPDEPVGLTICLGVLYHLKNPYYALERLAAHTRYCLLSTRIAQRTPKGRRMGDESLAYLLAACETNDDDTNYWIFSETGFRRLLDRTGWNILDFLKMGFVRGSEPARLDRDERAFCLIESRICVRYSIALLEGWHPLEENSFRWTRRRFSIQINRPASMKISKLRFHFRLIAPEPVEISASVNGVAAPPATFTGEGEHCYDIALPKEARGASAIRFDFSVSGGEPEFGVDKRELALLVAFWRPGLENPDPLLPFELVSDVSDQIEPARAPAVP